MTVTEKEPIIENVPKTKRQRFVSMIKRAWLNIVLVSGLVASIATNTPKILDFFTWLFYPNSRTEIHFISSPDMSINIDVQNTGRKPSYLRDCGLNFGDLPVVNAMLEVHPDDNARTTILPSQHVTIRMTTRGLSARRRSAGQPELVTKKEIKEQLDASGASARKVTLWLDVDESNRRRRLQMDLSVSLIREFILGGLPDDV